MARTKLLLVVTNGLGQGSAFLLSLALARVYAPEIFGSFVVFFTTFNFANIALGLRLDVATPYVTRRSELQRVAQASLCLCGLMLALALVLLAASVCLGLVVEAGAWLAALALASAAISTQLRLAGYLALRRGKARTVALLSGGRPVLIALAQLAGGLLRPDVATMAVSYLIGMLLSIWPLLGDDRSLRTVARRWHPRTAFRVLGRYRSFTLFSLPQNLLYVLSEGILPIFLSWHFGKTEAGLFWFAARLSSVPMTVLVDSVRAALAIEFAPLFRAGDQGLPRWTLRKGVLLGLPFAVGALLLGLAGEPAFTLLFGARWADAARMAPALMLLAAINASGAAFIVALPPLRLQHGHLLTELLVLLLKLAAMAAVLRLPTFSAIQAVLLVQSVAGLAYLGFYAFVHSRLCRHTRRVAVDCAFNMEKT
ncbi:lipopolysaccharide biosynthesis protein [Derxia gummosa]|uniref:Lipopolysaccharide biosynthesis protein n=1 Tax=Derxia gummosa DSM 723 TaxID=1121388 RepID=A0A8B6X4P6_9BURK|nr:hypothetical protein [Derxia gummosa]